MGTQNIISRRDFIKVFGFTLASLAAKPFSGITTDPTIKGLGRVTVELIYIYDQPSFTGKRVGHYHRDNLVELLDEIESTQGPTYNPLWYRVENGYIHSPYLQRVDQWHLNPPLQDIPLDNILGVVTVPYVRAYYLNTARAWEPVYRLYYQSTHWITGIMTGPRGIAMYRLLDDWLLVNYYVPAAAIHPLSKDDYKPFSSNVSRDQKRIEINLSRQLLTAYENDTGVLQTKVSTGVRRAGDPKDKPTTTPVGSFRIRTKLPSRHMGYGALTDDIYAYELPGVPWTMIFHQDGYALHGAYWHNNFGTRMSHGCVNMRYADAQWLFRWTAPEFGSRDDFKPGQMHTMGEGTLVQIFEGE